MHGVKSNPLRPSEEHVRSGKILLAVVFIGISFGTVLPTPGIQETNMNCRMEAIFLPDAPFDAFTTSIPMRDGEQLAADIYLPKMEGEYPAVLIQTPYNKNSCRSWFEGNGRYGKESLFTNTNYAFVVTDFRGRHGSGSALKPHGGIMRWIDEVAPLASDGYDIVEWIARQDWCNGRVGTWGPSALAAAQYETARANPPHLVCCVPMVMPLYYDYNIFFPGGVMWEGFVRALEQITGARLYDALALHPAYDEFWKEYEGHVGLHGKDIHVPMLLIGGWFDAYTDAMIQAYNSIREKGGQKARKHTKLIMGPWSHDVDQEKSGELEFPGVQNYAIRKAQAFFDYWLRDEQNNFDEQQPLIEYYQMGNNEWYATEIWPPENTEIQSYYLNGDGTLSGTPPEGQSKPTVFRYDPSDPLPTVGGRNWGSQDQRIQVENRKDVIAFNTPALKQDLPVTGKIRLKLYVSSDCRDTDFFAILTDVYPDDRSTLIVESIQRMRFRNSTAEAELMTPGEIYQVTIEFPNTAITFLEGHCIRLLVSSSSYPMYSINANDGRKMYAQDKGVIAVNSVYHDVSYLSNLSLPMVSGPYDNIVEKTMEAQRE